MILEFDSWRAGRARRSQHAIRRAARGLETTPHRAQEGMSSQRLIDAYSSGCTAEERVERDRLVGSEELDRSLGGAAGQRRVPLTGAIATLARERLLRLGVEHRSRGRKR